MTDSTSSMACTNFLRLPQVQTRTGLCKSTIYQLESRGLFPRRQQLSARAVGWDEAEIQQWKASRPRLEPPSGDPRPSEDPRTLEKPLMSTASATSAQRQAPSKRRRS